MYYLIIPNPELLKYCWQLRTKYESSSKEELVSLYNKAERSKYNDPEQIISLIALDRVFIAIFGESPITISRDVFISIKGQIHLNNGNWEFDVAPNIKPIYEPFKKSMIQLIPHRQAENLLIGDFALASLKLSKEGLVEKYKRLYHTNCSGTDYGCDLIGLHFAFLIIFDSSPITLTEDILVSVNDEICLIEDDWRFVLSSPEQKRHYDQKMLSEIVKKGIQNDETMDWWINRY